MRARHHSYAIHGGYNPDDGLEGGQWVREGLTWRWVSKNDGPTPARAPIAIPTRTRKVGAAECGTDSGYYRHRRRLKEPACFACRVAHAAATRERDERRKRGAA